MDTTIVFTAETPEAVNKERLHSGRDPSSSARFPRLTGTLRHTAGPDDAPGVGFQASGGQGPVRWNSRPPEGRWVHPPNRVSPRCSTAWDGLTLQTLLTFQSRAVSARGEGQPREADALAGRLVPWGTAHTGVSPQLRVQTLLLPMKSGGKTFKQVPTPEDRYPTSTTISLT